MGLTKVIVLPNGAEAGEDGGARRRIERAGRVGPSGCHTAFCESVEVGASGGICCDRRVMYRPNRGRLQG